MTPEIIDESVSLGRVRAELLNIQLGLQRGPKRTAQQRKLAWLSIAQEAGNRASAIVITTKSTRRESVPSLPLNGGGE